MSRKRRHPNEDGIASPDAEPVAPAPVGVAVELRDVARIYGEGPDAVRALDGVTLSFATGTFTAVMGASGSGKSTLLQSAAGLDAPTSGRVMLGGTELTTLEENALTELRRADMGFVFQGFNLLPSLTVLQNVQLPLRLAGKRPKRRQAEAMLERVGLAGFGDRRPAQLSGGQQQRVAIARALISEPEVIFADEPTGALDPTTAREILDLLRSAVDQFGATVVMVTHDPVAASFADRVVFLGEGSIVDQLDDPDAATVARRLRQLVERVTWSGAMNGLARASIRSRPATFVGTFVALLLASVVVMACGSLLQTGLTARVQPVRYADAPIVVAADQFARRTVTTAGDLEHIATALPQRARLDAALTATIAATPGVAAAVPDLTVELVSSDIGTVVGLDWSTRVLDGDDVGVIEGAAPGNDEVVLDAETVRQSGVAVGDTVVLVAPDGPHRFRVSGVVAERAATATDGAAGRRATAWFVDGTAAALAGQPGRADAIAVFIVDGSDIDQVAAALRDVLGPDSDVRTGSGRGELEATGLPAAKELLIGFGGSFGGVATFAAMFVVVTTMSLAVSQRHREIALLRAIGATPRQIRRMIATETLLIAPLAGAAGILPGLLLARWWFGQLLDRGAVPPSLELSTGALPAAAAVIAGLLAALVGGYAAARRPARTRPSEALGEAAVEPRRLGRVRWAFGLLFIALGVFLSIISHQLDGDSAAVASIGVVMTFLTAVALLGPVVARVATTLFGLPLSRGGAASSLAAANSSANSRRLASAITPIALVIAASGVLLFIQTTVADAIRADISDGLVADLVLTSDGPGLPATASALAADVPGVGTAVGILRADVLYNGFEEFATAVAIGVEGDVSQLDEVLDLGVIQGSLAEVNGESVALDHLIARSLDVELGDTVDLRLGDGTPHTPRVVAIYEHGLGLGQVLLPHELLARHVDAPFETEVLVAQAVGADIDAVAEGLTSIDVPGTTVVDRGDYSAQVDENLEVEAWSNRVMAAVFGCFAAIAAINTLVMVVLDRRREVALLRLTGTTRRQVQAMFRWEAAIVALTGIVLGVAIAWITLRGFARGATGGLPYIPPLQGIAIVVVAVVLAFGAMALPARSVMRRPPTAGGE